jgi:hypothetical protein
MLYTYLGETFSTHPTVKSRIIAIHDSMGEPTTSLIGWLPASVAYTAKSIVREHTSHFTPNDSDIDTMLVTFVKLLNQVRTLLNLLDVHVHKPQTNVRYQL